jgi:histidinol-phosphatase (PHP family)
MALDTDFHNHVTMSSALQMAQAAHQQGIRVLGLSEHVYQISEARAQLEHMPLEGPLLTFAQYIAAVESLAQALPLDVRLGLEVDFVPEHNERIQAALKDYPWDFLIGSVHEIDDYRVEVEEDFTRERGEALWLRYFELQRDAVGSGYFSLLSHPVRMRAANPYVPATIDDELERLAAEATRHDVALEINGYDTLTFPELVSRLTRACALHGTPISVGSDAHEPPEVAQAHRQIAAILRDAGISTVRIWRQRQAEEYNW